MRQNHRTKQKKSQNIILLLRLKKEGGETPYFSWATAAMSRSTKDAQAPFWKALVSLNEHSHDVANLAGSPQAATTSTHPQSQ